jgi:hypothetical protein
MPCDLTSGYNDRLCAEGKGGIKSITLIPLANIDTKTVADCEVTALDFVASSYSYHYKIQSNLSSYTCNPQRSQENGTTWYNQDLTVILNSDTKELRCEIDLILKNECAIMVEKAIGTFVLLGADEGLRLADGSESGSGTTKEDRNGHSLAFTGQENLPLPDVEATLAATIIANVAP